MEFGMIRFALVALVTALLAVTSVRASEIPVLGNEPVAEFTLPDGSVLKNAFVWRRSSEGLMIVHDDGQYFLNFQLLPDEWRAAYLGTPDNAGEDSGAAAPIYDISDSHELQPILERVPELKPEAVQYVLRVGADDVSVQSALALGLLQSLLDGRAGDSKRLLLLIEEMGLEIDGVSREELSDGCAVCAGSGRVEIPCKSCNGTGKCIRCNGEGERKTGLGDGTIHCTTCRGTGQCPDCAGEGGTSEVCKACRGRGQLLKRTYCAARRDLLVRTVNQAALPELAASVVETDRARIIQSLFSVPGLENGAVHFYDSDLYDGSLDDRILIICLMQALLNNDMEQAERFHLSISLNLGEDVLDITRYVGPCETCASTGVFEVDCSVCAGSGDCVKCGGDGEQDAEFLNKTVPCAACRGTGKCPACIGAGTKKLRCPACGGTGRRIERERAETQRKLLTDELNRYYHEQR